uniref:Uncharacterized protein n=1 Tax=Candidatus Kentrum sp. DK TaxID=2126562 RepID=A0A450S6M5_9GAMM|nr:MAG: hypothetical protein BECKDK2373C_GA0170839_101851 [Candidatus Kentron sp. DK]
MCFLRRRLPRGGFFALCNSSSELDTVARMFGFDWKAIAVSRKFMGSSMPGTATNLVAALAALSIPTHSVGTRNVVRCGLMRFVPHRHPTHPQNYCAPKLELGREEKPNQKILSLSSLRPLCELCASAVAIFFLKPQRRRVRRGGAEKKRNQRVNRNTARQRSDLVAALPRWALPGMAM